MNTVTNRTRQQDYIPMASNLVRGTQPRVPTFPVQRNGDESCQGCRGSGKDMSFGLNKYSRDVHLLSKNLNMVFTMFVDTVIAHLYTSRLYNTHYITERNPIALAWDSPHLQRSWRDHSEMIRDRVISHVKLAWHWRCTAARTPSEPAQKHFLVHRCVVLEIETQVHDRACCRLLMVMDSDKVAQSFVNYHEGYKVRHPLIQVSNDCTLTGRPGNCVFLLKYRFCDDVPGFAASALLFPTEEPSLPSSSRADRRPRASHACAIASRRARSAHQRSPVWVRPYTMWGPLPAEVSASKSTPGTAGGDP